MDELSQDIISICLGDIKTYLKKCDKTMKGSGLTSEKKTLMVKKVVGSFVQEVIDKIKKEQVNKKDKYEESDFNYAFEEVNKIVDIEINKIKWSKQ